jgi:hypothetical protein
VSERQTERREHKDDADVCYQPRPEVVSEEHDIHAHNNSYQSEHVEREGGPSSHRSILRIGGPVTLDEREVDEDAA